MVYPSVKSFFIRILDACLCDIGLGLYQVISLFENINSHFFDKAAVSFILKCFCPAANQTFFRFKNKQDSVF